MSFIYTQQIELLGGAKNIAEKFQPLTRICNVTDDRQTDDRQTDRRQTRGKFKLKLADGSCHKRNVVMFG